MNIGKLLEKLEYAAMEEKWDKVDNELIPKIIAAKDLNIVRWAISTIKYNADSNLRDAAATLIKNYVFSTEEWKKHVLQKGDIALHMTKDVEPNQNVRHKLGIAYAKNGVGDYEAIVIINLRESKNNSGTDVRREAEIASYSLVKKYAEIGRVYSGILK